MRRSRIETDPESAFESRSGRPAWMADLTHIAADILGLFSGAGQEARHGFRVRAGRAAQRLDLVTRAEFESCRAMLAKARDEQEKIKTRLDLLERGNSGGSKATAQRSQKNKKGSRKQTNL